MQPRHSQYYNGAELFWLILTQYLINGGSDVGKPQYKLPKNVIQAHKGAGHNLLSSMFEFCHYVCCMLGELKVAGPNNMADPVNVFSEYLR